MGNNIIKLRRQYKISMPIEKLTMYQNLFEYFGMSISTLRNIRRNPVKHISGMCIM